MQKINSILQTEKRCYITGRTDRLHKHHIFGGALRRVSEKHGFYVFLNPELHNASDEAVHFNKSFADWLRQLCQKKFEETHSRDEWMALIHRNFL